MINKNLLSLQQKSIDIKFSDKQNLENVIQNMIQIMKISNGVGLAAPQINLFQNIIVFDKNYVSIDYMINPKIIEYSEYDIYDSLEGCLSLDKKDLYIVKRYNSIIVEYKTLENKTFIKKFTKESFSNIIQHEIDHLNGILISNIGKKI